MTYHIDIHVVFVKDFVLAILHMTEINEMHKWWCTRFYIRKFEIKMGSNTNNTALQKKNWNTQLMSMIIFYVFLAPDSEFDIET